MKNDFNKNLFKVRNDTDVSLYASELVNEQTLLLNEVWGFLASLAPWFGRVGIPFAKNNISKFMKFLTKKKAGRFAWNTGIFAGVGITIDKLRNLSGPQFFSLLIGVAGGTVVLNRLLDKWFDDLSDEEKEEMRNADQPRELATEDTIKTK
jgi:hypothetical protein